MKLTVVVISFLCLVAFFHSCYGLQCYSCFSVSNDNPSCNKIVNDTYLKDFKTIAKFCYTLIKKGPYDVVLRRDGISSEKLPGLIKEIGRAKYTNHTIDFFKCQRNKCNDHVYTHKPIPKPKPALNRIMDDPNLQYPMDKSTGESTE